MATTNDAMFEALSGSYPSTGQTLGDLLYAFWSEKGLEYRGTLAYDWLISQGASGTTLGDLYNNYFSVVTIMLLLTLITLMSGWSCRFLTVGIRLSRKYSV